MIVRSGCSAALLALIAQAALGVFASPASAARYLYVCEQTSAAVAVIDTTMDTVVATIGVGDYPVGIVVNRAGTTGYVGLAGSGSVAFLDLVNHTVTRTVAVGEGVRDVALDAAGTRLYVLHGTPNAVAVLDPSTGALLKTISMPANFADDFPARLLLNRFRDEIYVLFAISSTIPVLNTRGDVLSGALNNSEDLMPSGLAVGPQGRTLYVANWAYRSGFDPPPQADIVTAIDTGGGATLAGIALGDQVANVEVDRDSSRLFVVTYSSLKIIDIGSQAVVASVPIQAGSWGIAFESASNRVYVSNFENDLVTVIDASSSTVSKTISVPGHPTFFAEAPAPEGSVAVALPAPATSPQLLMLFSIGLCLVAVTHLRGRNSRRIVGR